MEAVSVVIVLMGVSGSGKTTVGSLLAQQLGWEFADADDYHSAVNVEKMRHGIPLTDADRAPWLAALRNLVKGWLRADQSAVLACSALRQTYREELHANEHVKFVYLRASRELLSARLLDRHGHFMKQPMLDSQLAALEEPNDAITIDASRPPEEMVAEIRRKLELD